jgi:hypothetical protein
MFSGTFTKTSVRQTPANFFVFFLLLAGINVFSQNLNAVSPSVSSSRPSKNTAAKMLAERFKCFDPRHDHSRYSIILCGDVPDNSRPQKVYVKKEPGHVFLILVMHDTVCHSNAVSMVFGFYPRRPASSVLFKNVRCEIVDNGKREYDVRIEKALSPSEFELVLENAVAFAQKKYNLNHYNCYNYAMDVFNSLPGIEKLPVSTIRFPFIAGKGGSPCCLYRDLEKLKQEKSTWGPFISFGAFKAPASCTK